MSKSIFERDRIQRYLKHILENPGHYVHIRKLKTPHSKTYNRIERQKTMACVEKSLQLMGIEYDRPDNSYKIMVYK
jgi:hypothetical protein